MTKKTILYVLEGSYHAVAGHFNWSESKFEGISKSQGVDNLIESKMAA